MKNTKVLVVDPYLDVLGGGEKHILSIARVFQDKGGHISLAWHDEKIIEKLEGRFNLGLKNVQIQKKILRRGSFERSQILRHFDYLFYVTDGSYFFSSAKKTYIFCMYPQKSLYKNNLFNRIKWKNCKFIANSSYTASRISLWTNQKIDVLYPYVDNEIRDLYTHPEKKEKIILSVGRFFSQLHSKKQEILIESFSKLQQENKVFKDFKLVLIGGLKQEDKRYFEKIKEQAQKNESIVLLPNADRTTLLDYYQRAIFYWHAAGHGVNFEKYPEAVEHLGITPLEAMAAGCITFCHNSGGPKEYIVDGKSGFLYETISELVTKTSQCFDRKIVGNQISEKAKDLITKNFSETTFFDRVKTYFAIL